MNKAKEVRKDVYWVGALNPNLRVFDIIMNTEYGTTYNSFIVKGSEKTALFETAKDKFFDDFLEKLKEVSDPSEIDYIIISHTEPDHTGSLQKLLNLCKNAKVVATGTALRFLTDMVYTPFEKIEAKDGMELSLGDKTLSFMTLPNLHWPDSMFTYIKEIKTLATCDSFGCHYSDERIFNDLIDGDFEESYKYYFDMIMGPFKPFVLKALDKISTLEIETILNGHGPVLRKDIPKYIEMYKKWSTVIPNETPFVAIAYVSAYGYTGQLCDKIIEGINSAGNIDVEKYNMVDADMGEVMGAIGKADGVLFGSPTIVQEALPPILGVLANMNPVVHKGKLSGAFGSYGWTGEAVPNIEARLTQLKFKIPVEGLRVKFKPNEEKLNDAFQFGKKFGEALLNK